MKLNIDNLDFNILIKPDKDMYKLIQSNAKFKSLQDVVKTKVGINNFYNFSIMIKSSILMRDIILNCPYVSGWARSSQVLNDNDSKFDVYKFIHTNKYEDYTIKTKLKELEKQGHSMDNMRCLIPLGTITDYAINIDLLSLIYFALTLKTLSLSESNSIIVDEIVYFREKIDALLKEYDIDIILFDSMEENALYTFNPINAMLHKRYDFSSITSGFVLDLQVPYSVAGQLFRHRTLYKRYDACSYNDIIVKAKHLTECENFSLIGVHKDIAELIKTYTSIARNEYELLQGSVVPLLVTGTDAALHKALCQRACYINDSPQFKNAFEKFSEHRPDMQLLPPCKMNGNNCYVGYVNESRLKGEESTQIPCPIWLHSHQSMNNTSAYINAIYNDKTRWYYHNIKCYSKLVDVWGYSLKDDK